jgi:hypothetical protein
VITTDEEKEEKSSEIQLVIVYLVLELHREVIIINKKPYHYELAKKN